LSFLFPLTFIDGDINEFMSPATFFYFASPITKHEIFPRDFFHKNTCVFLHFYDRSAALTALIYFYETRG
jgi:hypothetical protein